MPGCGKSTIGRLLARRLQLDFVDADQRIEQHLGCTIRSYFDSHGEEAFRDVEQNVLAELLAGGAHGVLATGGGAVLRSANRALIRTAAQVFYLRATPDEIWRRVRHDTKRPLLQVANPLQRLRDLYAQRDPLYREVVGWLRARGVPNIRWRMDNLWATRLEEFDVVYAFLSPAPMPELWVKIQHEMKPGSLFVSNSFPVPDIEPENVLELDDARRTRLYCYRISDKAKAGSRSD